jgi:hypothetical protein
LLFSNLLFVVVVGAVFLVMSPLVFIVDMPTFVFLALVLSVATVVVAVPVLLGKIVYPIVVLETASPWRAIAIGFRRVRNSGLRRSLQLGLTVLILDFGPSIILNAIATRVDSLARIPALVPIERAFVGSVTTVYVAVLATVISLEMTVRHEGTDLEAALEASSSSAAIAASGSGYQENGATSSAAINSAGSE